QKKETASQLKMDDLVTEESVKLEKAPEDPLLTEARKLMEEHQHISASFLQRHLRIGYPRAARLMEQLEEEIKEESGHSESTLPEKEQKDKPS
ncbi:MAG TPA: DNA translocase FtsK, partial [Dehalococcoidales bacterium]|nr:DNA translocase FtsK [Dehalococcoidales bacterium]